MKHKLSSSRQKSMLGINKVGTSNFFSRCIKPNDKKMADLFDQERVMTQLKYTGVLETTRLRKEVCLAYIANRKYQFKKAFVFTNGYLFKRSQHHATSLRQQCCTMLDENFKLKPTSSTSSNIVSKRGQHVASNNVG